MAEANKVPALTESQKFELQRLCDEVDTFAAAMKAKLHQKVALGIVGWDEERIKPILQCQLLQAAVKLAFGDHKQDVDVANYAMFLGLLWWRDE